MNLSRERAEKVLLEEAAGVLKVSDSTIERDWKFARAWLARELDPGGRYG